MLETCEIAGRGHDRGGDGRRATRSSAEDPEPALVKALGKGLLKVLSKLGISTVQSYRGAQAFEAVGLDQELVDIYFTGTASRIGGVGLEGLAREALPVTTAPGPARTRTLLPVGGIYAWRRDGERHGWNPETMALVQQPCARPTATAPSYAGDAQATRRPREPAYEVPRLRERVNEEPRAARCAA